MTIKKVAAYHEAGHVILAQLSRFHSAVNDIDLGEYGQGSAQISLSRHKLQLANLAADASSQRLPMVAVDLAVVLCGGYAAEELASQREPGITPDVSCSGPDFSLAIQQLATAGAQQQDLVQYCALAKEVLNMNWHYLHGLAGRLFELGVMSAQDAYDYLTQLAATDPDRSGSAA